MVRSKRNKLKKLSKTIKRGGDPENIVDECPICKENLFRPGSIYIHNCNNKFHYNCIQTWCKNKEECSCPICRQIITEIKPLNNERELINQLITGCNNTVIKYDELKEKYNELTKKILELTNNL